jgi:alpha-tubulin suppressor-like RCC1 family protein
LSFQWFYDGVPILGATNRYLFVTYAQMAAAGNYVLVASNAMGLVSSTPVSLIVQPDPVTLTSVGAWGDNIDGQCSVSHAAVNPRAIAAGPYHSLALNEDGTVAAWGKNWDKQTNVPPSATNVMAVAAGGDFSLALKSDGSLVAWGRNWDGQTNVPPEATNVVAVAAGLSHSVALRADGTVVAWGNNQCGQTNVPPFAVQVDAVAAGYYHSLALLADHSVVAWGLGNTVPASATNVVAISGGWWHSLALRADGSVVAWGDNSYGQCSVPASVTNIVGIAAGYAHSLALRADGTIAIWGQAFWGATNAPKGLGNVARIAASRDYNLAMVELGPPQFDSAPASVVTHVGGQAILGAGVEGTHPLSLQWFHDDHLMAGATNRWLLLTNVQLADAGNYTLIATNGASQTNSQSASLTVQPSPAIAKALTPRYVPPGASLCLSATVSGEPPLSLQWYLNGNRLSDSERITGTTSNLLCLSGAKAEDTGSYSVVASNAYGCVTGIVAQHAVSPILVWGDDSAGQLDVPFGNADVASIAAGDDHSLALRPDGTIVAWGDNSTGQNNMPQIAGIVTAVADGGAHSMALRSDGGVVAWGDNTYGQTNVPSSATRVVAIAAGHSHSLALRVDGTVMAWGARSSGQTNVPFSATNVVAIAAGGNGSLALRADGTVVVWGSRSAPPASATNIVAIAAGSTHALALRADGVLIAWGGNYYGQATVPGAATNVLGIAAGGDHSLALLADGTVVCWGADYFGQASVPLSATNLSAISAGGTDSLALTGGEAPRPAFQPFASAVSIGQAAWLSAGSLVGATAHYQWQLNGLDVPGATTPTLWIGFATWTNAGIYCLVTSNALARVMGPPVILTVLRTPLRFDDPPQGIEVTNGEAHLHLLGASGVGPVVLFASSNLLAWEPILTNPPIIGPVQFADAAAGNQPWRFYRAFEGAVAGPLRIEIATVAAPAGQQAFPLRLTGLTAERPVVIYASSNLLDWAAIFTNPPTIGPLQYMEAPSTVQPQRFYRASENH